MLPPRIKNRYSDHPQTIMRPVHLRLSEEIIKHLEVTAQDHGFDRIQGLIRLYIRQGLDRDNSNYTLADDVLFIEKLRKKGVSQKIIDEALADVNQNAIWASLPYFIALKNLPSSNAQVFCGLKGLFEARWRIFAKTKLDALTRIFTDLHPKAIKKYIHWIDIAIIHRLKLRLFF